MHARDQWYDDVHLTWRWSDGVQPRSRDRGSSLADSASLATQIDGLRRLNVPDRALHNACDRDKLSAARWCLDGRGARVDAADPRDGVAPLHVAAMQARTTIVRLLLVEHAADPNIADESDARPLHRAAASGSWGVCALLLGAGADPATRTRAGDDAAAAAALAGHASLAARLRAAAETPGGRETRALRASQRAKARWLLATIPPPPALTDDDDDDDELLRDPEAAPGLSGGGGNDDNDDDDRRDRGDVVRVRSAVDGASVVIAREQVICCAAVLALYLSRTLALSRFSFFFLPRSSLAYKHAHPHLHTHILPPPFHSLSC